MLDPHNSLLNTIILFILFIVSLHIVKPKIFYEKNKIKKFPYYSVALIALFTFYLLFQTIDVVVKLEKIDK